MENKDDDVIVVTGFKKNSDNPVYIPKSEDTDDAVVLKFKNDEISRGFKVDIPEGALSNVVLQNMASVMKSYMVTKGFEISDQDLGLLVSSMTTRMIYVPLHDMPEWLKTLASYFTENVFYAESASDEAITKCVYAACRNPERIHVLLLNLHQEFYFPEFLEKYITTPASAVEMKIDEYINDVYIPKARIPDNIFVFAIGDETVIPESVERQYAIWNPVVRECESHLAVYSVMGINAFKNMYRVFEPISDSLWNKMNATEDILHAMGFRLTNKDSNHLDDYLVCAINQQIPDDMAFKSMVLNRLVPMVQNEINKEELVSRLHDAGIITEEGEN